MAALKKRKSKMVSEFQSGRVCIKAWACQIEMDYFGEVKFLQFINWQSAVVFKKTRLVNIKNYIIFQLPRTE